MLGGGPITKDLATPISPKIRTLTRPHMMKVKTYGLFHITKLQKDPKSNNFMDIHVLAVRK